MRSNSLSSSTLRISGKAALLLGCAIGLSACNTTGENQKAKTALISPAANAGTATASAANSAQTTTTVASAAKNTVGQPTNATVASAAFAATAANPAPNGVLGQTPTIIAQDGTITTVEAMPDPVLPVNVPVPGVRGEVQPMMAFASAKQEASPASLAANMQFVTPPSAPQNLDGLIEKYAVAYEIPERLVRRVVHRESRFNPGARNGPYWGLMQISHATAKGMGYQGAPKGLLDAETNLKYAVKYLAGAYKVADGNESQAVRYYARGYYYDAKRKGLLKAINETRGPTRAAAAAAIKPVAVSDANSTSTTNTSLPGVVPVSVAAPAQ